MVWRLGHWGSVRVVLLFVACLAVACSLPWAIAAGSRGWVGVSLLGLVLSLVVFTWPVVETKIVGRQATQHRDHEPWQS